MDIRHHLAGLHRSSLKCRAQLQLENLALRQQLAALRRGVTQPKLEDKDRTFWIGLMRLLDTWRDALILVKPETVAVLLAPQGEGDEDRQAADQLGSGAFAPVR